jgi:hypothetical protein
VLDLPHIWRQSRKPVLLRKLAEGSVTINILLCDCRD